MTTAANRLILLHEIYGITDNLRRLADELTRDGYQVQLPSLYPDGFTGKDEASCYARFFAQVGVSGAQTQLEALLAADPAHKPVLIGFSIGATLAWLQATDPRLASVVAFYGSRIRHHLTLQPRVPTQLFFCPETRFDIAPVLTALTGRAQVQATQIPGYHGFYSKEPYDSDLVQAANRRIRDALTQR